MASIFGGQTKSSVVVWEWTNDQGDWSPYEAQVSNFIEDNSTQAIIRLGDIDKNSAKWAVNIGRMVQLSQSGTERPIRRELYDGNSCVAHGAIWKWRGDSSHLQKRRHVWHSYSMEVANKLEAAYNRNSTSLVDLDVHPINEPYVVDLGQMVQINKGSGFCRPVERLVTNSSYRIVGSQQQSWSHYLGSWFSSGGTNGLSSGYGSSSSSGYGNSTAGFGSGMMPAPSANSVFGPSNTASAGPGSSLSSMAAGSSGFAFSAPLPGGQQMFPFGSMNPPPSWNPVPLSVPSSSATSSSQIPSGRPAKRVRALRRNLTPGISSTVASGPSVPTFSFAPPASNWLANANGPAFAPGPGPTSSAFSAWRNPQNQPSSSGGTNDILFGQNQPLSVPSINGGPSSSSGGSRISLISQIPSAISSLISGFSSMAFETFRYVTTGGNSNQSVSPNASLVPVSSAPSSVITQATKSGARTIGGAYVNTKRLKVSGDMRSVQQDDLTHIQKLTARDVLARYIKEVPKPPANEDCCICCDSLREASGYGQGNSYCVIQLVKCSHMFHMDCLSAMYDSSSKNGSIQCPSCKTFYGTKYGNCPNGIMEYAVIADDLPGYKGCSTIEIRYNIYVGRQGDVHPNPGHPYKVRGFPRICYLPNNHEGQKVLSLLEVAWKRRLTFTIGTSVTTGEPDVVVWNEIHHKTEMTNASGHGYPDPNYLSNVLAELAAQGVTDDDQ